MHLFLKKEEGKYKKEEKEKGGKKVKSECDE